MERDDIIEYSLDCHHSEEEGKKIRKKIWQVTAILSIVTTIEVLVGVYLGKSVLGGTTAWEFIKIGYIILTLFKAALIVLIFMHLGDERKSFKKMILTPYLFLITYLIYILLTEAGYVHDVVHSIL